MAQGTVKDNARDELDEAAGRGRRDSEDRKEATTCGSEAAWLRGGQGQCPGRVGRVARAPLAGIANPRNLGRGPKGLRPSYLSSFTQVRGR
jgi:hypothetical protein